MCNDTITPSCQTNLLEIDIVPGGLCVLEDSCTRLVMQEVVATVQVGADGHVRMIPADAESVAIHSVIVRISKFRMEGGIFG